MPRDLGGSAQSAEGGILRFSAWVFAQQETYEIRQGRCLPDGPQGQAHAPMRLPLPSDGGKQ